MRVPPESLYITPRGQTNTESPYSRFRGTIRVRLALGETEPTTSERKPNLLLQETVKVFSLLVLDGTT